MATGRVPTTANSPLTAKGDLFGYSTAPARLAVGNDGESLVADSSTSTGLRYQSGYNGNAWINGGFDIWQRGTSIASTASPAAGTYTADRFRINQIVGKTVTRQSSGLTGIQYCARVQRDSGGTSTSGITFGSDLETADSYRFAGQTVTFSYYARAGANYSSASSALTINLISGTGTDQNNFVGFTGSTVILAQTATLTTSWQRFTGTVAVASSVTQLGVQISYTPVGTAGANDYFEITGVQLELGSVATTFKRSNGAGGTIQGELAACQRYLPAITTTSLSEIATGFCLSTTQPFITIPFQVPARVAPTGITATATNFAARTNSGGANTLSALVFNNASPVACAVLGTVASGLVQGNGTSLQLNGTILFTGCEL